MGSPSLISVETLMSLPRNRAAASRQHLFISRPIFSIGFFDSLRQRRNNFSDNRWHQRIVDNDHLDFAAGRPVRAATARTASSLPGEPSMPTMIRTGEPGSSMRPRAMRTEHFASVRTLCETLPSTNRPRAVRPCEPTTTRSGFHWSARKTTSHAGEPQTASADTFHPGKFALHTITRTFSQRQCFLHRGTALGIDPLKVGRNFYFTCASRIS